MAAGSSNKVIDMVITDFDNEHVFIVHPKRRKDSCQSTQTLETEVGGSSLNISKNTTYPENDIELDNIQVINASDFDNDSEAVFVIHPKPRRGSQCSSSQSFDSENGENHHHENILGNSVHSDLDIELCNIEDIKASNAVETSCQRLTTYWKNIKSYFTVNSKDWFNWSIIQTWYNMEFLLCAVPFYIRQNEETKEYEKCSFRPQQVLWAISTGLLVLEMLSWVPKFLRGLDEDPNPYVYLRMASFLAAFMLRCSFLKLACCEEKLVIDYLNTNSRLLDIVPKSGGWVIASKTIMLTTSISFALLNIINVTLGLLLQAYVQTSEWGWTGKAFLYTYVCYGRQMLTWVGNGTCIDIEDIEGLYLKDMLYGILGLTTCTIGLVNLSNAVISILSCTSTLCLAVLSIRHVESVPVLEKYNVLKDIAGKLSEAVGPVLTTYMIYIAISLPDWIRLTFQNHNIVVISVSYNLVLLLTTKILGCVATLHIDRMKGLLTGPEGVEELPNDMKQFISAFQRLFHNSVGIGYPGLFVLNFRLLFSYLGIICSIIVVIYETMKDLKKDD